ncbi:protein ENHANCED DISEASE RESISTANCE 2-like isoform X2 [Aristolochia californica]|uniref:protein ENHANCED DISEASE RESISTANCE 2-like isoform X2 n=1 Tax=Aristolochia californica TaxID=171875 RepID=UPI0035E119CE
MSAKMHSGEISDREGSEAGQEEKSGLEYFGWIYHLGVNSIGHEYCHLRFLFLRGRSVQMYKRDPHENPGIKPIRKGIIGPTLMVEELGRRKVHNGDLYVLRFCNRLDETKKGEIACATAGEASKWMEAFEQAKQQLDYELAQRSGRHGLSTEAELNLEGHRPRVRRYAHGLKKLIRIGKGIRILEDVASLKSGKGFLVKSVGVVDASADMVFEVVLSLDKHQRYEWDMMTGDLELVDSINGHYDVVYGTYDPKYLTRISRWNSKRDFVFSRQWFRGQDGAYTILQFPAGHKKRPPRSGYLRTKINPSTWEIRRLDPSPNSTVKKCLVTQMLEINSSGWGPWKERNCVKFEKTIPYALLCQVSGLREYFEANPALTSDSPSAIVQSNISTDSISSLSDFEDPEIKEEFYDALAADQALEDEDSDDEVDFSKSGKLKLKSVSWALASLVLKHPAAPTSELDTRVSPVSIEVNQFNGTLPKGTNDIDTNCWTSPGGQAFKIRGKTYLTDYSKVMGSDPLLKLLAVDWLISDDKIDGAALNPKCLVQSEAGKKLPFILVINLQVPAKPNYSLVLYYGADRPISKGSLLSKFVDGSDIFRDSRFKLIPSIVEGYWMVKRAVGTKACLLGKAVTCRYLRQDNFLEIDVDIGSSSVARSIISLVLGYVTSLVVDLAILIEAKEEKELPEYILGTVRLNRIRLDSAV